MEKQYYGNNTGRQQNNNNNFTNYSYAPYNFIPLSKRVIERYKDISELPAHNEFVEGTLSGEITYVIENNTDLIISNGNGKFFIDVDDNYAIPGSTIRGKIRSNINVLGFSTVGNDIEDDNFLYRRVAGKSSKLRREYEDRLGVDAFRVPRNVQAGYIKKINEDEYVIIKSKVIKSRTYFRIAEKDLEGKYKGMKGINFMHNTHKTKTYSPYIKEISFNVNEQNNSISDIAAVGVLKNNGFILGSGKMKDKTSHYIINDVGTEEEIKISSEDIRAYNKYYIKDKKEDKKEDDFYSLPNTIGKYKPVFYIQYNGRTYFGFTPYLRLFYDKTIHDGITTAHKNDIYDYNKAIFGFANSKEAYKSRISVQDAVISKKTNIVEHTMVLSEPKATCIHLYLKQDGDRNSLNSYNGEFEIRGIKYYWLKNEVTPIAGSTKVNSVEEAITKGAQFKGKISFNNLYEDELGLLLWSLYIDKDAKQNIGKGKPYGFGNISIKDIKLSINNLNDKYDDIFGEYKKEESIIDYINKYKTYAKSKFNSLASIEEDLSIKTFIEVHKNMTREEKVSYMSLKEFTSYIPLSTPFEIMGIDKKAIPKPNNRSNNNKGQYSYNKSGNNYSNKSNKNKSTVRYNDGELKNDGLSALKNYFK